MKLKIFNSFVAQSTGPLTGPLILTACLSFASAQESALEDSDVPTSHTQSLSPDERRAAEWEQALELKNAEPANPEADFWMARLYRSQKDYAQAINSYYRGLWHSDSANDAIFYNITMCHYELARQHLREQSWSSALREATNALEVLERADIGALSEMGISDGETQDSIQGLLDSIQSSRDAAALERASALLREAQHSITAGEFQYALISLEFAARLNPDSAVIQKELGRCLAALGRRDEARAACLRALQIDPDYKEVHFNLGLLYAEMSLPQEALTHFQEALSLAPDDSRTWFRVGLIYHNLGQFTQAHEAYTKAIELDGSLVEARLNRATLAVANNDLQAARQDCLAAIDTRPDHAGAAAALGQVEAALGNHTASLHAFDHALMLAPENQFIHEARNRTVDRLADQHALAKAQSEGSPTSAPTTVVRDAVPALPQAEAEATGLPSTEDDATTSEALQLKDVEEEKLKNDLDRVLKDLGYRTRLP